MPMIRLYVFLLDFLIPFLCDPDLQCGLTRESKTNRVYETLQYMYRQCVTLHVISTEFLAFLTLQLSPFSDQNCVQQM